MEHNQLLISVDDGNLPADNIDTIKKNSGTLTDSREEIGLEINVEETSICCCLVTRMQVKIVTSK
jgi:hypothetical protein